MTTTEERTWMRGDWMQTFTGKRFFPLDPKPEDIDPVDIAHALSLVCRYGGHIQRFYSVAEHCVLMSLWVEENARAESPEEERDLALWALLHDATEAYVGDMVRPLKRQIAQYQAIEADVMDSIAERFGLISGYPERAHMPTMVKHADNRILLDERATLMPSNGHAWVVDGLHPLGVTIHEWSPWLAEQAYLERLRELGVTL